MFSFITLHRENKSNALQTLSTISKANDQNSLGDNGKYKRKDGNGFWIQEGLDWDADQSGRKMSTHQPVFWSSMTEKATGAG